MAVFGNVLNHIRNCCGEDIELCTEFLVYPKGKQNRHKMIRIRTRPGNIQSNPDKYLSPIASNKHKLPMGL